MNRSKRGRQFRCPGLTMCCIACLRYAVDKSLRAAEGLARAGLWNSETIDHAAVWRRACAKSVTIQGNRIRMDAKDNKTNILMAGSAGVTTAGWWIEFKRDIKCSHIKLHIPVKSPKRYWRSA